MTVIWGQSGAKNRRTPHYGTRPIGSGGRVVENARTAPRAACGLHAPTAAAQFLSRALPRPKLMKRKKCQAQCSHHWFCAPLRIIQAGQSANSQSGAPGRILNNPAHPVQIIYAGKAHPHDDNGKQLIAAIIDWPDGRSSAEDRFLENYDVTVARYNMVSGLRRLVEYAASAVRGSGTSGMKARQRCPEFQHARWMVGEAWELGIRHKRRNWLGYCRGETYSDFSVRTTWKPMLCMTCSRAKSCLRFMPAAPRPAHEWISRMKASIAILCPEFNMHRMVKQYTNEYYMVAHNRYLDLGRKMGPRRGSHSMA